MFSTKYGFRKYHGHLGNFQHEGEMIVLIKKLKKKSRISAQLGLETGLEVITGVLIKNIPLQGIII